MIIYQAKDYKDLSRKAANIISAQVIMKPNAVLGLATGSSPVGTYQQLIEWYKKGDVDFSNVTSINLDEYRGLSGENKQSYRCFMNTNFLDHINIKRRELLCRMVWSRTAKRLAVIITGLSEMREELICSFWE